MSANDILDVLNIQRDEASQPAKKRQKTEQPALQKGGMARELYNLLGPNTPPVNINVAGKAGARRQKVSPWTRMPFVPNKKSGTSATFSHWEKGTRELLEADGKNREYFFDKFLVAIDIPEMVDESTYDNIMAEIREQEHEKRQEREKQRSEKTGDTTKENPPKSDPVLDKSGSKATGDKEKSSGDKKSDISSEKKSNGTSQEASKDIPERSNESGDSNKEPSSNSVDKVVKGEKDLDSDKTQEPTSKDNSPSEEEKTKTQEVAETTADTVSNNEKNDDQAEYEGKSEKSEKSSESTQSGSSPTKSKKSESNNTDSNQTDLISSKPSETETSSRDNSSSMKKNTEEPSKDSESARELKSARELESAKELDPANDWEYEETKLLFEFCKGFELKWHIINDRFPVHFGRSMEDLKEQFYRVCAKILKYKGTGNPNLLESLDAFSKPAEIDRKQYLESLLKRTPAEIAEEESLVIEARRFELAAKKMLLERTNLLTLLDSPQSSQSVQQYQSSQGLTNLYNNLMILDKHQKKKMQSKSVNVPADPVPPPIPSAASSSHKKDRTFQTHLQQYLAGVLKSQPAQPKGEPNPIQQLLAKRLTTKEEEAYGLMYHANERLTPNVLLRSAQKLPGLQQRQSVFKAVNSMLQELEIPTAGGTSWKPNMPTRKTMTKYDELIKSVVALLEVKKGKDKLEAEIALIKSQRGLQ